MPARPTRLQVETYLIGPDQVSGRRGRACALARLYAPGAAPLGAVPALAGPLAGALRFLGVEPADPLAPSDADLAAAPAGSTAALHDVADLLLAEAVLDNWDKPDQALSLQRQDWGAFAERLRARVNDLRDDCRRNHGYGLSAPSLGRTDLGFAASSGWCGGPPP